MDFSATDGSELLCVQPHAQSARPTLIHILSVFLQVLEDIPPGHGSADTHIYAHGLAEVVAVHEEVYRGKKQRQGGCTTLTIRVSHVHVTMKDIVAVLLTVFFE